MGLRLRLWLGLGMTLLVGLLGLAWFLYSIAAQTLQQSFVVELKTLARQYAQLALELGEVRLREAPPSPLEERLGKLEVFLLRQDQRVLEQLRASTAPTFPTAIWQQLERNEEAVFWLEPNRAVAAFPIFSSTGQYRLAYVLALAADDLIGASSLERLRQTTLFWALAAVLVAAALGQWLTNWLLRPLEQIRHTAAAVSGGNLAARIQTTRQDELGQLQQHLNQMLVRLEQAVEAQRRFTANAAHDLRTPIAVLRTELEVALRRERRPEEYRALLERLLERCQQLSELTEDLLALSKLEAGLEVKQALELRETLGSTFEIYQAVAEQRGLLFVLELPELRLHGDAAALKRLFANLLSNAAKFAKRRFGLRAKMQPQQLCVWVWDDGTGIPEAEHEQMFERFRKGSHATGTGLGLAIALEAARAHGGTVILEPSQIGAVFRVELPLSNRVELPLSNTRLTQEG